MPVAEEASLPRHMPYGGTQRPFSIGLSALPPSQWIEPDHELSRYLDEKRQLLQQDFSGVFRATEDSQAAQAEALAMLADHLATDHADIYRRDGGHMTMAGQTVDLCDNTLPPLLRAGLMVQDDLAILIRDQDSWRLAAGFVAFPSSWSLAEKAGRPMEEVHANVPGFQSGTRNAKLVNRIFDNLQTDLPASRLNWSFKGSPSLAMPVSKHLRDDPFKPVFPIENNFLRVERQTLRRLPETGAILFTIRIYADPLTAIARHPDKSAIAAAMIAKLENLSPEERSYKDMSDSNIAALIAYLQTLL
ncbi:DUF3445 domain-containing protein [Martelella alba]|uniref:DUF3445 domain-containing protein n=1 Tax=Martelella alba TaxID=2590451 RepID=A0A506UBN8_9HYPH|nr:DUF3445 domain-containing protein [Martelella alba]TPW30806.1 DUF3445 domain-containing protein [Martelella alba]